MTRTEVIAIARDVGMCGMLTDVVCTIDELERFAALVEAKAAAKEREACAQVCDDKAHAVRFLCNESNVIACAAAIRARGNK